MTPGDIAVAEDHEHSDGCLCGVEISEEDLIGDVELPPAFGGIEMRDIDPLEEDAEEGCDAVIMNDELTDDVELPATHVLGV